MTNQASGETFQIFKTPAGHWRAYQLTGAERNYASFPAEITQDQFDWLQQRAAAHRKRWAEHALAQ